MMTRNTVRSGALKTAAATAGFALLHSALASRPAKQIAARALGERGRNAFYRPFFNLVAVASSAALVGYIRNQPTRTVYRAIKPAAFLMRVGQLVALAGMADTAVKRIKLGRFAGWPGLMAWLGGARHVPREPEGQSPLLENEQVYDPGGVFRLTRNPANFFALPLLWLNPTMTWNLLAFNLVSTMYFYVGSIHSDWRLAREYGRAYDQYSRSVPLFLPKIQTGLVAEREVSQLKSDAVTAPQARWAATS